MNTFISNKSREKAEKKRRDPVENEQKGLKTVGERAEKLERRWKISWRNNLERHLSSAFSRSVDNDRCGQPGNACSTGF